VVCGDGVEKEKLQGAAADLSNVHFLSPSALRAAGELLSMADIHLLPQSAGARIWFFRPAVRDAGKRCAVIRGMPVRARKIDSVVSQCGLGRSPQDSGALAAAICKLADDPRVRLDLGPVRASYAESNFERRGDPTAGYLVNCDADMQRVADDAIA